MNRWSKNGVLDRVFEKLQHAQIVRIAWSVGLSIGGRADGAVARALRGIQSVTGPCESFCANCLAQVLTEASETIRQSAWPASEH